MGLQPDPGVTGARLAGRRVLVTGATGAIGGAVVAALRTAGADVHALVRRLPSAPADVTPHLGDLTNPASMRSAIDGSDAVVHLAALLHLPDPTPDQVAEFERINAAATATLMTACLDCGVSRVVYASTIAVYGSALPVSGARVDEATPCRPTTAYGRTKLAGETHVLAACDSAGRAPGVVLRLAAVYGPSIKGNYRRLLDALARGRYVQVGAGANRRTLVHERDVAQAIVLALVCPAADGQVYNVTDGHVHRVSDIVQAMSTALARPAPRLRLPVGLVRPAVAMVERLALMSGRRPPVSRASLDTLLEDVAVDGTRLQVELGYKPAVELAEGWADVVRGMHADARRARPVE